MIPKFRAWDKANKKMCDVKAWSEFNGGEVTIKRDGENASYVVSLDDIILMQSTGLFDKNGVEIFDGDILEVTDTSLFGGNYRGAVGYLDNWGVYGFSMLDAKVISTNEFDKHSIGFLMKEFGSCFTLAEASRKSNYSYKNIGNIYKNPDLLERVEVE